MKQIVAFLLAVLLLFQVAIAFATSEEEEYDVRTSNWGDSVEDVKAKEGDPVAENEFSNGDTLLVYKTTAVGLDVTIIYKFGEAGLSSVIYGFNEEHSNASLYILDYEKFRTALTNKYGEPTFDNEIWDNSRKKYYENKKGDALLYGYLIYATMYDLDRTEIVLMMSADNYKVSMMASYSRKDIELPQNDYSGDI